MTYLWSIGTMVSGAGIEEPSLFVEPGIFVVRPNQTLYFAIVQTMPFARPSFGNILKAIDSVIAKDYPARGEVMFNHIEHYFGDQLGNCKIAVWGLAFKALTNDGRESPAITLAQRLIGAGASLEVHDPQAMETAKAVLGDKQIEYCQHMYDPLKDADALVVCTEWQEFRTPDFARMPS